MITRSSDNNGRGGSSSSGSGGSSVWLAYVTCVERTISSSNIGGVLTVPPPPSLGSFLFPLVFRKKTEKNKVNKGSGLILKSGEKTKGTKER